MKKTIDIEKAVGALKFVLKELGGKTDFHKSFKILYFADQQHLVKYGRTITADKYIAMGNGPVPSTLYDIAKYLKDYNSYFVNNPFVAGISVEGSYNWVLNEFDVDMDIFSLSEIEELTKSIKENKRLNFGQLTDKSHDIAWNDAGNDSEMSIAKIAEAANAKKEMIQYIIEQQNMGDIQLCE